MDLNDSNSFSGGDSRSGMLLSAIADDTTALRKLEVERLGRVVDWAVENTVTDEADAATIQDSFLDTGLPIAGAGAPLVSEFALMELSATLGRSTDSGREYVGKIVELAFRLPELYARVSAGEVEVWRALAIADRTRSLNAEAAAFVDRQLAPFAPSCSWAQIDRLVAAAIIRFDPELAEQQAQQAAEHRHLDIDLAQPTTEGTVLIRGEVDLPDGLDLEHAITGIATQLGDLGDDDSLDVRRAKAVGELARGQQVLDLETGEVTEPQARPAQHPRPVTIYLRLSESAVQTLDPVAECDQTRSPHPLGAVQRWLEDTGATVTIKPYLDLTRHDPVDGYTPRARQKLQVEVRDRTCAFPYCGRQATRCDADHAVPYAEGGLTCPCNLVACCRRHHRAKTHSSWGYVVLYPGTYLWTSAHGRQFLVDRTGTRDLSVPATCPRLNDTDPPDE